MAMKDWDFGYLGKGLEGYMHYKNTYDRTFGGEQSSTSFDYDGDDSDSEIDELNNEIDDLQDEIDDLHNQLVDYESVDDEPDDGETVSATISIGWGDESESPVKSIGPPPHPLPANYDLTKHYWDEDAKYRFNDDLRKAMCDYLPEYKESYKNSDKSSNDILLEIFSVDKPLALKMWVWELEHFQTALHDPETGFVLTTMSYSVPDVTEWIFRTQKSNQFFWSVLFGESTVIDDTHADFLRLALENNDVDFFYYLMNLYENNSTPKSDYSYALDTLLEEILKEWYDDASQKVVKAMREYIQKVEGSLRRAALEKRCLNAMVPNDEEDEADKAELEDLRFELMRNRASSEIPLTKARCEEIVAERHRTTPLPDDVAHIGVTCAAGLFAADKQAVSEIKEQDTLIFVREPDNQYDANAIRVDDTAGRKIGYIPKSENMLIAQLMDIGAIFHGTVIAVPTDKENTLWLEIVQKAGG
ncbi:HIRAN domain-containing protein [Ruminococcaceae bacterium OttesenSCG-928-I18]|nr:HIRAN domain-containing protein [Ruminococcaceae bacterium OttesenSCG-928-I18]